MEAGRYCFAFGCYDDNPVNLSVNIHPVKSSLYDNDMIFWAFLEPHLSTRLGEYTERQEAKTSEKVQAENSNVSCFDLFLPDEPVCSKTVNFIHRTRISLACLASREEW
ncbi:hypothetical protein CSKR_103028 [Clonorchis sinensis]|uniref:Uncharacterized protein n=1 Tax=Clonorchis sinensis TaxID=79923 RepID=A0A3R7FJI1_CLOSI|nr:hypothetical protein CSKR_103028 [Clonorchis sinensis]